MEKYKKIKAAVKKKIDVKKILSNAKHYCKTNILAFTFLAIGLLNDILLRCFTVKNYFNFKPILGDMVVLLVVIIFGYLVKPKHRFRYFLGFTILFSFICIVNFIYYFNYISFVSLSLLKTSTELKGYAGAVTTLLEIKDLLFLIPIIVLIIVNKKLVKKKYYDKVAKREMPKSRMLIGAIICGIVTLIFMSTLTSKDFSRLHKQWDRRYTVMEFGVYIYQINDLISTIRTNLTVLVDSDKAYQEFVDFYENREDTNKENKYTNIFKGKNVLVIHGESIQGFTMNLKFNGEELTPNINKMAKEGLYFSNFYTQESIGNSSDSEFTLLTSLLPVYSGTVFVNYFDRTYTSLPGLLRDNGYYTFSMHANVASAWNRANAYKYLGYDHFYAYEDAYEIDEVLGLGLSDKSFFRQSTDIIDEIEKNNGNFYGTLIMLTNHTPFTSLVGTEYNDDYLVDLKGETEEDENIPYLEGTKMGNYLKSVNYADSAIGELLSGLDERGLLDNTVIVLYGDHDSKIKKSEFERLYYSEYIDQVLIDPSKKMEVVDNYTYEINRKVPFIIWTKDGKYRAEVNKVMGMVDVMPTLGNMLGVKNKYALGHDIFSVDENIVIFPDGNYITDEVYYDASKDEYLQLNLNSPISLDYLINYQEYASKVVSVSNKIIIHDLIKKQQTLDAELN